ncbi:hypothetical protein HPB52_009123 [Rhipicephalus sanguineus]|uniref:CCHC-type domain-containing protein n=1 Tax=Rhipicephalus sanguineus TaxID=34632 RepID=A0A9D4T919_RHISA|nr:hypothetical protein HPB52_009123 [Rhipicephalus sanguineus]
MDDHALSAGKPPGPYGLATVVYKAFKGRLACPLRCRLVVSTAMAAPQQLRPLTFYGRVPKGTTNVDICKEFVKRFSPNELKCVQEFGAGRFEVTFANMAAVERFLANSVDTVRNVEVKFEYRGVRVKTVRVLSYPVDASDSPLLNGFAAYGKVIGIDYEHVPDFKSVLTGNRRVRVEMARPIPNLLPCEYDGVVRLCRRCFFPGHHAADCKVPQCERCAEFGHARCEVACKRCGDDHALSACKARTYSSVAARVPARVSSTQVTSGAAESQEAPSKGSEGSPLPEREPVGAEQRGCCAEAPGGGEQGRRPELAEASAPSAVLPPLEDAMDAEAWKVVRGRKRRARSRDSSDERPAAAACGGPGDLEEGLPGVKRTAATDSDEESTQSTVKGSTAVGDFNCVLEQVDRVSLEGTPKYRDRKGDLELRELVDELGLVDAWRTLRPVQFADSNLVAQGKIPWRLNPRLLKDKEAAKDVAGLLCRSLLDGQDLGGSEWDAVKASVAECFREWGKRRAREERTEIKIVSDAILLLSKPLSGGPGVTAALTSLRKELRVLLQRRWDRLRATTFQWAADTI